MIKVKLKEKIKITKDSYSFIFQPTQEAEWKAGQYIFYRIPHENADSRGVERHFTISSAPHEKVISLTTKFDLKNGSSFKRALFALKPGETIEAYNIGGKFTIDKFEKKYVFLAGGIGITPFRSLLLDIIHRKKDPDITMLYGNNNINSIIFRDLLDRIESEKRWFKKKYIIKPQLIDKTTVNNNVSDLKNCFYYVSGPFNMVKTIENILVEMNIDKENMTVDYFPGYDE